MPFKPAALAIILAFAPLPALAEDITVFAAASLKTTLTKLGDAWAAQTGHRVTYSFAGTSALARQIQEGAPADLFISASVDWMDKLAETGDIRPETRRDILGNRLVLVAHGAGAAPVTLDKGFDLVGLLGGGKLAMALVDSVPAGQYGRAALTALGLWDSVSAHIAQAENVTGALQFVATGEAALGIVYATDAKGVANVSVIATFPDTSHVPITYPAAITALSTHPAAAEFLTYLSSDAARAIWQAAGFKVPE